MPKACRIAYRSWTLFHEGIGREMRVRDILTSSRFDNTEILKLDNELAP